jgi:hypothetical protein
MGTHRLADRQIDTKVERKTNRQHGDFLSFTFLFYGKQAKNFVNAAGCLAVMSLCCQTTRVFSSLIYIFIFLCQLILLYLIVISRFFLGKRIL